MRNYFSLRIYIYVRSGKKTSLFTDFLCEDFRKRHRMVFDEVIDFIKELVKNGGISRDETPRSGCLVSGFVK